MTEIEALVEESHLLHGELWQVLRGSHNDGTSRGKLATIFLELASQHALAFRCLMVDALTHSAIPLLRLQFEATVKGFWVKYAADEEWIRRAGNVELKNGRPVEPPQVTLPDMLKALQDTAHPLIGVQLSEFKESNLKPLHSFVHSGISALSTLRCGLPDEFCCDVVRLSNGLAGLGATLLAEMALDEQVRLAVLTVQLNHLNCMPKVRAAGADPA